MTARRGDDVTLKFKRVRLHGNSRPIKVGAMLRLLPGAVVVSCRKIESICGIAAEDAKPKQDLWMQTFGPANMPVSMLRRKE